MQQVSGGPAFTGLAIPGSTTMVILTVTAIAGAAGAGVAVVGAGRPLRRENA